MSVPQVGPSSGPPQFPPVPTGHPYPKLLGYQALGNLMGGFPEVAIFRRFRSAGALDLLYREADIINRIDNWAEIANDDRNANDNTRRKEYDVEFDLLLKAQLNEPDPVLGSQWRAWLEVRERLREYYDELLKFQKICNLAPADQNQLQQLRKQLSHESQGDFSLRGLETLAYHKRNEADLTSIASLEAPDIVTKIARGPIVDYYHKALGLNGKEKIKVPQLADSDEGLEFPYKAYSPEYALRLSRILYAAGISILITTAIVTLNFFKNVIGRIILIGVHNLIFTVAAAVFTKGKPGELFAVAAAYAAVLVVFASGSNGPNSSS